MARANASSVHCCSDDDIESMRHFNFSQIVFLRFISKSAAAASWTEKDIVREEEDALGVVEEDALGVVEEDALGVVEEGVGLEE